MTGGEAGALYVVSTPIGNLGDITHRALEVLRSVSVVLAEDTRHSRRLLDHYQIRTPLAAYHEHNEAKATPRLVTRLLAGESMAMITDAGTPLLSDPGARLVAAAAEKGIAVVPIPGASALLAALVASAIEADRFTFFGFLDRKGKGRGATIDELRTLSHTAVLYESPNRTGATLSELVAAGMGSRRAAVARELTKQFEEVRRGTLDDLARYYGDVPPKGEVVIVIAGAVEASSSEEQLRERVQALRASGASARDIASSLVDELGAPRNLAYRLAHES
jgi:16S rRNA (cytidine1402-2'-O)-methyltransferase